MLRDAIVIIISQNPSVEEFFFVFKSISKSGLSLLSAAFLSLGVAPTVYAQSPQLLPYTSVAIAGSTATTNPAKGATCPVSGYTTTDTYGDGCLATEIALVAPRYAIADSAGTVYFSDYTNGLVRRIDPSTGIVTTVAGGATASPAQGAACGTGVSLDKAGDGCLSTLVKLYHPTGLAFAPNGDLYFADSGNANVRKIAATGGLITNGGVISLIAGNAGGTYGYASNNASGTIVAATSSYLDGPYGLSLDAAGNLYIAEEYKNAVLVVNTNATGSTTVTGVSIPAGTIAKIAGGYPATSTTSTCPNGTATPFGCSYGSFGNPSTANAALLDAPYAVATDPAGNVYFANEYIQNVGKITTAGTLTQYAGTGTFAKATSTTRATSGTFGIGSDFGIAADANSNVYITDSVNGVIWRIDATNQSQYIVAGLGTPCAAATDAFGDGCPATQATFGKTGTSYATASAPGIFGVTVDQYSNLYVGDTTTNLIRQISSGTQFGSVGANQPTNIVDIHFGAGDTESTGGFTLTSGATSFSLGTAVCTTNTDSSRDCLLPVTATPTALGPFTGTLQVTSSTKKVSTFPLSGMYVTSPLTRTAVAITGGSTACASSTTFGTNVPLTITATVSSTGTPMGTITFYANGTQIGAVQTVASSKASITYTFATAGTYSITAVYSGDSYFKTSTGKGPSTITSSNPTFTTAAVAAQQNTVVAGQTGLYSFTITQSVYTGTLSFACSNLPALASCSFSPSTITATGCSTGNTVAVSILTTASTPVKASAFGGIAGGRWQLFSVFPAIVLALFLGLRRRSMRHGVLWMSLALLLVATSLTACGKALVPSSSTPSGTYTVTISTTGSTGTSSSFTVPLTVK